MNSHKNARTTFEGRKLLIERIAVMGLMPAAEAAGISARTARKWRDRFEQEGLAGLLDRSSRPLKTRSTVDTELAARIGQLRRARESQLRPGNYEQCLAGVACRRIHFRRHNHHAGPRRQRVAQDRRILGKNHVRGARSCDRGHARYLLLRLRTAKLRLQQLR